MRLATLLLFLVPVWAQVKPAVQVGRAPARPAAAAAVAAPKITISRQTFRSLEDGFNQKLNNFNPQEPIYMLGMTRGVYLQGYGAIFSAELDLIQSPTVNPFHQKILAEDVVSTHARKLKQLPLLRQAIRNQLIACAKSMDMMPPNEQIVMVLRLDYQTWEDMVGLPAQIMMKADLKSAAIGDFQVEEQ
jgi:hypothetical protein